METFFGDEKVQREHYFKLAFSFRKAALFESIPADYRAILKATFEGATVKTRRSFYVASTPKVLKGKYLIVPIARFDSTHYERNDEGQIVFRGEPAKQTGPENILTLAINTSNRMALFSTRGWRSPVVAATVVNDILSQAQKNLGVGGDFYVQPLQKWTPDIINWQSVSDAEYAKITVSLPNPLKDQFPAIVKFLPDSRSNTSTFVFRSGYGLELSIPFFDAIEELEKLGLVFYELHRAKPLDDPQRIVTNESRAKRIVVSFRSDEEKLKELEDELDQLDEIPGEPPEEEDTE